MRRLPPLAALRAFEAAARHLSFKAAAEELGVTPTAISHQIQSIEHACGQALFRRRPRPLALTPAGARLFPAIRDGLDGFAAALSAARGASPDCEPLRITTTNAFASRWLVPRLPLWRAAHPDIPLEVIGTDGLLDLRAGEADLAIRYARLPPPDLVASELVRDRFIAVCAPSLLAAGPAIRRPADLARHTLIHAHWQPWEPEAPTWERWLAMARRADPDTPEAGQAAALTFREELHAIEAAIAGQGVVVISDLLVARELESGALLRVLPEQAMPGFGFYLVHLPHSPRRAAIAAFTAWARSMAA